MFLSILKLLIFKNNKAYLKMEESQDIITHLKFIGRVRQGEKINVKHLFVQPDGLSTRISRTFINIDSRNNTLSFINNTVKKAVDFINLYKNNLILA